MARRYHLDKKIEALNFIDENDGDVGAASVVLEIPDRTLRGWQQEEDELRRAYDKRQRVRHERMIAEIYTRMLERGQAILARMDESRLEKAPLNQLATALNSLVNNALKLEEEMEAIHEPTEKVVRFEHFYDGSLHETPPWAGASEGFDRTLQDTGVWEALGQDPPGRGNHAVNGAKADETLLVAGADANDDDAGMARLNGEHPETGRHHHQRERAAH